jgi:hypothetical protein
MNHHQHKQYRIDLFDQRGNHVGAEIRRTLDDAVAIIAHWSALGFGYELHVGRIR